MYGFKMHLLFVGISELLRRDVVQEWVYHRTEVKEGVCNGKKGDICSEVGHSPVLLRFSSSHDPSNLIRHPTYCQSGNNQSCDQRERERTCETNQSI
uniref:Uncharacterized protein n=1 Tax=Chelonoidis abingdonii TaxID=106734 RepID=A0A8C0H3N9_CHEAB